MPRGNGGPRGLPGFSPPRAAVSVRAARITYTSGFPSTLNGLLPPGTIAGDLLVIFGSHGYTATSAAGATLLNNGGGGGTFWKIATPTDISNGYVSVTFSGGNTGEVGVAAIQNVPTPSAPIRVSAGARTSGTTVNIATTTPLPVAGDLVIYWSGSRKDGSSGMTLTMPGTVAASDVGNGSFSAYISQARASAAAVSMTGTWSARDTNDQWDSIVVVKAS